MILSFVATLMAMNMENAGERDVNTLFNTLFRELQPHPNYT
jgi:hypothetical protein